MAVMSPSAVSMLGVSRVVVASWGSLLIRVSIGVKRQNDVLRARVIAVTRVIGDVLYALNLVCHLLLIIDDIDVLSSTGSGQSLRDLLKNSPAEVVGHFIEYCLFNKVDLVADELVVDGLLNLLDLNI